MLRRTAFLRLALGAASLSLLAAGALALSPAAPRNADAATPTPGTVDPSLLVNGSLPVSISGTTPTGNGPRILNFEGYAVVAPGGVIKIDGVNFGGQSSGAKVCMQWTSVLVQNAFTQNGQLCLDVVDWQDTRVIVQVPADVTGVPDQTAHVVLTTGDGRVANLPVDATTRAALVWNTSGGQTSNALDIKFVATREERLLTDADGDQNIVCGLEAEHDVCGWSGSDHWDGYVFSFGATGTDAYQRQLAHGWTFERLDFSVQNGSASLGVAPVAGSSTFFFTVNWNDSDFDTETQFSIGVWVFGPKGVPLS